MEPANTCNPTVNKGFNLGSLNTGHLFVLAFIVCVTGVLVLFDASWQVAASAFFGMLTTAGILGAGTASTFMEKLYHQVRYGLSLQAVDPKTGFSPKRVFKKAQPDLVAMGAKKRAKFLQEIEALSDLYVPVSIELGGLDVGCYLLKDVKGDYFSVFAWEVDGLDPSMTLQEATTLVGTMDQALRVLPNNSTLTFDYLSHGDDSAEQENLDALNATLDVPLEKAFVQSQKDTVRRLTAEGERQNKTVIVYLRTPVESGRDRDYLNVLLDWVAKKVNGWTGKTKQMKASQLRKLLLNTYSESQQRYTTTLKTKFGVTPKALSLNKLFGADYLKTHTHTKNMIIPQVLHLRDEGLKLERKDRQTHSNSYLFMSQDGLSGVPEAGRQLLYHPVRKKYLGCLQVGWTPAFAEGGNLGQVTFINSVLDGSGLSDYRIVTQIGTTKHAVQKWLISRQTREKLATADRVSTEGDIDVDSEETVKDSTKARRDMHRGVRVNTVACVIWLERDTPEQITQDFKILQNHLGMAPAIRCWERVMDFWAQCQAWTTTKLFTLPFQRTIQAQSSEASGYIPLVKPPVLDDAGLHLLAKIGKAPLHINLYDLLTHLLIFATTRGGKSVLLGDLILGFYLRGIPGVVFDFPKETTGASTFRDLVMLLARLGGSAAYFDIGKESSNLIELPDLRSLSTEISEERLAEVLEFHKQSIARLVLGGRKDEDVIENVGLMVNASYDAFQADPEITRRYGLAIEGGFGSDAYQQTPTLLDYLSFLPDWFEGYEALNVKTISEDDRAAVGSIIKQLTNKLSPTSKLRKSIASPSTINPDSRMLVYALRGLKDDAESEIFAMSAYSALLRKAFSSSRSYFVIDESPILFKFPAISKRVGSLCSNGLKFGVRVIISSQTSDDILQTPSGAQIMKTVHTKLAGNIQKSAVKSLSADNVGFSEELVRKYVGLTPDPLRLASQWLIMRGKHQIEAEYIPSDLMLSIVANNNEEQDGRDAVMERYPLDLLAGILHFSQLYVRGLKQGKGPHIDRFIRQELSKLAS